MVAWAPMALLAVLAATRRSTERAWRKVRGRFARGVVLPLEVICHEARIHGERT